MVAALTLGRIGSTQQEQGTESLPFQAGLLAGAPPLAFRGGDTNLYRYVHNDPTDRTDPTGLSDKNKKTPDIRNPSPNTPYKRGGPSDVPSCLKGTWKVYIRASNDHAWILYYNPDTGEKVTLGRYLNGYGDPPVAVPGVQMNQDIPKESGNPDTPKPGVGTRPPVTVKDPILYGGFGYNALNDNCASYAKGVWQNYTGEYFNTGNLIWYSPGGLKDSINAKNKWDNEGFGFDTTPYVSP